MGWTRFGFWLISIFSLVATIHCEMTAFKLIHNDQAILILPVTGYLPRPAEKPWSTSLIFGMIGRRAGRLNDDSPKAGPLDVGFFFQTQTNYGAWGCRISRKLLVSQMHRKESPVTAYEVNPEACDFYITNGCLKALEKQVETWKSKKTYGILFIAGGYIGPTNSHGTRTSDQATMRAADVFPET